MPTRAETTTATRIRKPGCIPCRERHVRCDRALPVCSSCRRARASLECQYAGDVLKVRPSPYSSQVAKAINSIPQQPTAEEHVEDQQVMLTEPVGRSPRQSDECPSVFPSGTYSDWPHQNGEDMSIEMPIEDALTAILPTLGGREPKLPSPGSPQSISSPSLTLDLLSNLPLGSFRRTVSDSQDAQIFGFYINNLGPWLDIVSPSRYFGEVVPRIALSDSALYYACLTCAARVLMLRGEVQKSQWETCEDKAIAALIPRLSLNTSQAQHDTLPATIVILRMAEQFSEVQEDPRRHLLGASSLFANNSESSSLGAAAFWVYVRQSIRAAFLNEEPCQLEPVSLAGDIASTPAGDAVWANRMTLLLARTCSACWDSCIDTATRLDLLDELMGMVEQWRQNLPEAFQPWCDYRAENELFPIICFISRWHVVAWQYYYASKVLIGLYRKSSHMNVFEMSRYMEAEVLSPTRLLCAITFSCEDIGVGINGTHLVSWCSQVFSGQAEQRRVMEFLQDFMSRTKWPNQTCCERLEKIWSGESRSWVPSEGSLG